MALVQQAFLARNSMGHVGVSPYPLDVHAKED